MITDVAQRWRDRRSFYRPAGELFDPRRYEVALLDSDDIASAFVAKNHYSRTFPAARARVGMYCAGELVGVLVASQPAHPNVLVRLPGPAEAKAELGRLVLLNDVAGNGESWFIARAAELLSHEVGIESLVSFSDPIPRTDADGREVFAGHYGGIYQASNARFVGRASPNTIRLLPDGTVFSKRAWSKVRARERGWEYAAGVLERHGAARLGPSDDSRAWLKTWLPRVTRPLRHPGNWTYLLGLTRTTRRLISRDRTLPVLAYPKLSFTPEGSAQ